jgi:hypothetical protein
LSVHACALMMAEASSDCLTSSKDRESGNVDHLVIALKEAGLELAARIDGEQFKGTSENIVLCVAYSLQRALAARPPQEVVEAVIGRIKSLKHAPRANKAGCAELEASLRREARSFAALDAASAEKVTADLPELPKRDAATVAEREQEYNKWTGAPAAEQANVCWGVQYDSYALGATAPLQKWPNLRGRPTLVAHPLTKIEGVELGKIKEMDVLAKMLRDGEKKVEGKKRKRQGDAAEESGEEESG